MLENLPKPVRFALIALLVVAFAFGVRSILRSIIPDFSGPPASAKWENSPYAVAEKSIGSSIDEPYLFTDQDGNKFDVTTWLDKPLVVSYIFTNCADVCPVISVSLKRIIAKNQERLGRDFRILSVGFDLKRDTPDAMKQFGKNFAPEGFENWKFVTGDDDNVRRFAKKLGIIYQPVPGGGWAHTVGVTIVASGKVYAQVFGSKYSEKQILKPIDDANSIIKSQ